MKTWIVLALSLLQALVASAQPYPTANGAQDPPNRVARLSVLAGEVQLSQQGNAWFAPRLNMTLTERDQLWTGRGGRVELDFGNGQLWLNEGSQLVLTALDDNRFTAQLITGQLVVRLREIDRQEITLINTPAGEVELRQAGYYRVEATPQSLLHVRYGEAVLRTGNLQRGLYNGDAVSFDGGRIDYAGIRGQDYFDQFADGRDNRYAVRGQRFVSTRTIGWRDLDEYGQWHNTAEYGAIWYPRNVSQGWAPYRNGHWSFVQPWGWTWVDDAPWGYAPFHYGRWVSINNRWAWCPGAYEARPAYSPALVAWYGSTANALAWVPLSWGEYYRPGYWVSDNRYRSLNQAYVQLDRHGNHHDHWARAYQQTPQVHNYRNTQFGAYTQVGQQVVSQALPVHQHWQRNRAWADTHESQRQAMPAPNVERVRPSYNGAPVVSNITPMPLGHRERPQGQANPAPMGERGNRVESNPAPAAPVVVPFPAAQVQPIQRNTQAAPVVIAPVPVQLEQRVVPISAPIPAPLVQRVQQNEQVRERREQREQLQGNRQVAPAPGPGQAPAQVRPMPSVAPAAAPAVAPVIAQPQRDRRAEQPQQQPPQGQQPQQAPDRQERR
jgi:FecR protein